MIGIGSPLFCQTPFMQAVEEIAKEFRLWEILSEGENRLELIGEGVAYGRDSLGMEFQVHAPLSDVNIGSVHEPMRLAALHEVEKTIDLAHKLEIELVTVHPGFIQGIAFLDKVQAVERTKRSVRELASYSSDRSVRVVIENLPGNMNATCSRASELLEVVEGSGLGICFDMGHANTAGQVDAFLELVSRFGNVHLHNNEGQWDQHNRIDDGSADIRKIVSVLKSSYKGNMIIESTDLENGVESRKVLERLLG
jgi:sugar phosphate isomerase/epimerase